MSDERVSFIAHARLKDIVGRGLINDDNVAIIELIKNAKDAGSKEVRVTFHESADTNDQSRLIVQDFGSGMSKDDIRYKWLNIAYSEKRNTAPKGGGAYAGNKGIGRFSCDRLGRKLSLYTRSRGGELICLEVDWTKFEVDDRDTQIGKIKARIRDLSFEEFEEETGIKKFTTGTTLVISEPRTAWPKDKLLKLRKELERFVIDPKGNFSVFLFANDYPDEAPLNGLVENKIFEKLDFRTTSILASINSRGDRLEIALRHDGEEVFSLQEHNPYSKLKNIKLTVFFLNQAAKAFFKRQTDYHSVEFGSVFLFLNGFRVLPYGEEADDWLGLDRRKQQGTRRFLGTRDIVGYVEIEDQEEVFQPTSSREGVVHNLAFDQLARDTQTISSQLDDEVLYGLFHKVFRKLERFVVEGLDWDRIKNAAEADRDLPTSDLDEVEFQTAGRKIYDSLIQTIMVRTPRRHLIDTNINLPFVVQLAVEETESYDQFVESLQARFDGMSAAQLTPSDKRNISRFVERQAKELAARAKTTATLEKRNTELTKTKEATERKLEVETKRRLFAEYESTADQKRIVQMHHQIGLISSKVFKAFDRTIRRFREDPARYSKNELISIMEKAIFDIDKVRKVSKFASKASFDLSTNRVNADLVQFIEEYVQNFSELSLEWNLKTKFQNSGGASLERNFRPIELTMLIDNLIDNAGKASAKNLLISVSTTADAVIVDFVDDGRGLSPSYKPDEFLHAGITTTEGSGIGLNHAKKIVEDLDGQIMIKDNKNHGATVQVKFAKK